MNAYSVKCTISLVRDIIIFIVFELICLNPLGYQCFDLWINNTCCFIFKKVVECYL